MSPDEQREEIRRLRMQARFSGNTATAATLTRQADELEGLAPSVPVVEKPAILQGKDHRETARGYTIGCPACQAEGRDSKGEHLLVFEDGGFACALWPVTHPDEDGRAEHRSIIAQALGLRGGSGWVAPRVDTTAQKAALAVGYAVLWDAIKTEFSGPLESLGESGPLPTSRVEHFSAWCRQWVPGELCWTGRQKESRSAFMNHVFHPADEAERKDAWDRIVWGDLDHTFLRAIKPDACSRSESSFLHSVGMVIEHDGPKENRTSKEDQVALARYLKEAKGHKLRMVVGTGGKGYHFLFDTPPSSAMPTLRRTLEGLGADTNTLDRCMTRVPGAIRASSEKSKGGALQEILWINPEN